MKEDFREVYQVKNVGNKIPYNLQIVKNCHRKRRNRPRVYYTDNCVSVRLCVYSCNQITASKYNPILTKIGTLSGTNIIIGI